MKIYIPIIISIIFCMAYCLCINLVNIYKPIAHMDISIGILFRLSVIIMFLTLLMGMLTVRFTKRKYLIVIPIIMPILLWSSYVKLFPYRSFVYMGISALIYFIHISILWYYNKAKHKKNNPITCGSTSPERSVIRQTLDTCKENCK